MAHARRFRFGVQVATAPSGKEWADMARRAEDLGYSTLFMPDHFGDQLAPVPALMAAADATTSLRIGTLVFDNDYKHPVVLAKEAATLDLLSGGRVELGLGAGWMASDYEQSGIPDDPAAVRVDRMEEGIAVLKGLFADGGVHLQRPALPDQRAQRHAEAGAVAPSSAAHRRRQEARARRSPAARRTSSGSTRRCRTGPSMRTPPAPVSLRRRTRSWPGCAQGAGDRFDDLEINLLTFACMVTDDREDLIEKVAPAFGLAPTDVAAFPHAMIGSIEQICEDLEARRERWQASYIVVQQDAMEPMAPVVARLTGG